MMDNIWVKVADEAKKLSVSFEEYEQLNEVVKLLTKKVGKENERY